MKRIAKLALIACLTLGAATVCSAGETETEEQVLPLKTGLLAFNTISEDEHEQIISDHIASHYEGAFEFELTYYDNMTSLLMALQAKDIYAILTGNSVAEYMVAQNDTLMIAPATEGDGRDLNKTSYMMLMREEDAELHELFDKTISELKEDGTLDTLIENSIMAHIDASEPESTELPVIEGAETVTVAVTGDLPPMDYVAADGTPAGFNVDLLAEISKKQT